MTRALDSTGDWTFGSSRQNYLTQNKEIEQRIITRLRMIQGDCFFSLTEGIAYELYIGQKVLRNEMDIVIRNVILATEGVEKILEYESYEKDRKLYVRILLESSYGLVELDTEVV